MQLAWVISWDSAPGCCVYQQPYPTTLVSVVSASCQGWPLSILFSSKPAHTLPLWAESSPIPFFYLSQQASHKVRGLPQPRACSCAYSLLYRFLLGVLDPSLCLFCCFCTWLHGALSCSFGYIKDLFPVFSWFSENCSASRCIFDVFVERGELHILLLCNFVPLPVFLNAKWLRIEKLVINEKVIFGNILFIPLMFLNNV